MNFKNNKLKMERTINQESRKQMKNETIISFEVRKNPKREAIVKYYKNGLKRIIIQVTREEMNKCIIGKLKENL